MRMGTRRRGLVKALKQGAMIAFLRSDLVACAWERALICTAQLVWMPLAWVTLLASFFTPFQILGLYLRLRGVGQFK